MYLNQMTVNQEVVFSGAEKSFFSYGTFIAKWDGTKLVLSDKEVGVPWRWGMISEIMPGVIDRGTWVELWDGVQVAIEPVYGRRNLWDVTPSDTGKTERRRFKDYAAAVNSVSMEMAIKKFRRMDWASQIEVWNRTGCQPQIIATDDLDGTAFNPVGGFSFSDDWAAEVAPTYYVSGNRLGRLVNIDWEKFGRKLVAYFGGPNDHR
jgi:hypothetical protein